MTLTDAEQLRLHRRAGRRRPRQRRARDRRRHGPQHGPAAPRHPRHAAHRRPPRRRAGHLGRRGVRLHAPRLREALRGPQLPAGHHAGEPHRLARQLRQRGAVHPRRRAAHGGRGAAARQVDPHDPLRAQPHRQRQPLHRRPRPPARRPDAGVLRLPRPRVRAQPDRGGHRRPLPPELRPHRRPQGRPAQGLDRRDEGRHGAAARLLRRDGRPRLRQRDLPDPHPRHRRRPRPTSRCPTACPAPTSAARASTGTSAATPTSASPTTSSTGRSGPTPTATASPAAGCASRRSARPPRSSTSSSTGCPSGSIMAKVPRIIKVPEGEAYVADREPARRDGLLRRVARATPARSG